MEEIKKQSSKWVKEISPSHSNFYWQEGYCIFSVNPSEKDIVINYIRNQKGHHCKRTFKEELIAFLKKYEQEYNDDYLWE